MTSPPSPPPPTESLHVTTRPLPGAEQHIPAGLLVLLTLLPQGKPTLRLPRIQEGNRWIFQDKTYVVRSPDFLTSLQPRPNEGFFITQQPLHFGADWSVPERSLIQLSYSHHGDPILYFAQLDKNTIKFPSIGYRFPMQVFDMIKSIDLQFASPPAEERQLH